MFNEKFKKTYALSDHGVESVKKGTFWTIIVNIVVMTGIGILHYLMMKFMNTYTNNEPLPSFLTFVSLVIIFLVLSFITHLQQYINTYGVVYDEVKTMRVGIAERLRKLPLSFFGK